VSDRSRLRLFVIQVLVLSLLATLIGRLWYLQVMASDHYSQAAADNRVREVVTPAVRGQILDATGRPLVKNRTTMVVSVDTSTLAEQADGGNAVLHRLAGVLHKPYQQIAQRLKLCGTPGAPAAPVCWNGSPYQPIPVADNTSPRVALQIMQRQEAFPGVSANLQALRTYPEPFGARATHLLGYLGPVTDAELQAQQKDGLKRGEVQLQRTDLVGRDGLESEYDSWLRGKPGITRLAVDHTGAVVGTLSQTNPQPGDYLVTSINARLQAVVEQQLKAAIARARSQTDPNGVPYKANSGAAVVLNAKTGQVLAMASEPDYNPSIWVNGITQKQYKHLTDPASGTPMLSRATQGQFAPASTFKVVSTSAAVQAGYPLNGYYPCPSSFTVGTQTWTNFESEYSTGPISFAKALAISCDTVYYKIAYDLWLKEGGLDAPTNAPDPMTSMAKSFGFGQKTGIDLPGEASGRIADRAYKKWYWEQTKDYYCNYKKRAPASQQTPYLLALAAENCTDGWIYRAGDAVNFAIGQGDTTVTPLQLARAYMAVANGGTLWRPQLAEAVVAPDGQVVKQFAPKSDGKLPVPSDVLQYIQNALAQVPVSGTAQYPFLGFPLDKIPVAAKTGTGEVYGQQTTSWFASYAPANDPQYVVVMMVPHGGTGALTSGASVRAIYEALFGIHGQTIDPKTAIYPDGPPTTLPKIKRDGTIVVSPSPNSNPSPSGSSSPSALAPNRLLPSQLSRSRRRRGAAPPRGGGA
jgi:penicillin-binding protein 2